MKKLFKKFFHLKNKISLTECEVEEILKKTDKFHPESDEAFMKIVPILHNYAIGLEYLSNNHILREEYLIEMVGRGRITPEIEAKILAYNKSTELLFALKEVGYVFSDKGKETLQTTSPEIFTSLFKT